MAPKSKVVEYVSKQRRQSFKVPMRDEDGKQISMLDGHGRPIYVLNKQQYVSKVIIFNQLLSGSIKKGYVVGYSTEDPEEISVLDKLCADKSNKIMRAVDYKKEQNPALFEKEQENEELKAQLAEARAYADKRAAEHEAKIKDLEAKAKAR